GGARLGDRYYLACGMREGFARVVETDVFDFGTRTWSTAAAPAGTRIGPELVPLGGKLYLVGGSGEQGLARTIEEYDPARDAWRVVVEDLPFEPAHVRAFPFRDGLLLFTAHDEQAAVAHVAFVTGLAD
ncbi:MAG TPA: hypothetical protein VJP77_09120, partial [Planctomycetota bacterium]|nr:hypothetical protein [Planctomycetota bacterium]